MCLPVHVLYVYIYLHLDLFIVLRKEPSPRCDQECPSGYYEEGTGPFGCQVERASLGVGVWGVRFGVWGLGFSVWGLGFSVWV